MNDENARTVRAQLMAVDVQPLQNKIYEATEQAIMRLGINPVGIEWPRAAALPFDCDWKYWRDVAMLDEKEVLDAVVAMLEEYVARNGAGDVMHLSSLPLVHLAGDDGQFVYRGRSEGDDTLIVRLRMYAGPASKATT